MNQFEELNLMKTNPIELFKIYLELLENGIQLDESQLVKFKYLKKLFIKEEKE